MFSVLKNLNLFYQKVSHKFKIIEAKTDDEIKQCLNVRKTVFGEELKRDIEKGNKIISETDEFDKTSSFIACVDTVTEKVVGSVRVNLMLDFLNHDDFIQEYRIDTVDKHLLGMSCVLSRFVVLKEYREQLPGYLIIMETYRMLLEKNYILACFVCEPQLFPMYRKLGFRPMGRIQISPFGGYRLPVVMVTHDYDHLEKICSPWIKLAKEAGFPENHPGVEWFQRCVSGKTPSDTGFIILKDENYKEVFSTILDDLSKEGLKGLMHHATLINCNPGDELISAGGGENYLGIIKKGALEIIKSSHVIATLGEGDVFGEIAFILKIPRTASVVAATPDTKVILLSAKAINRLKKPEDIICFWQNLSKILARRLISSN